MGGRGRVNPPPETPFHADSNELLLVSKALTFTEISAVVNYDYIRSQSTEICVSINATKTKSNSLESA
jgi:hypothetical protein